MTPTEYANKLRIQLDTLKRDNRPLQIGAYSALAEMAERIFVKGGNSAGSQIGQYNSTTPIYINPNQSPKKFPTKGKSGNTTFADGTPHKTGYFESYKAFRGAIGRRTDTVNLQLTGDLKSDLENPVRGVPTPTRININEYQVQLNRDINIKKREGLEKKYGTFTEHTPTEINNFYNVVEKELTLLFQP